MLFRIVHIITIILLAIAMIMFGVAAQSLIGANIMDWVNQYKVLLTIADETMIFGSAGFLISGVGIYQVVHKKRPTIASVIFGLTIFLSIIFLLITIAGGRLVYQMFGQSLDENATSVFTTLIFAGLHIAQIVMAVLIIAHSLLTNHKVLLAGGFVLAFLLLVLNYYRAAPSLIAHMITIVFWSILNMMIGWIVMKKDRGTPS
jgi:hypothetical protein